VSDRPRQSLFRKAASCFNARQMAETLRRANTPFVSPTFLPVDGRRRLLALPRYMGGAGRHSRTNVSRSPRGVVPFTAVAFACTRIMPVVLPLCAP